MPELASPRGRCTIIVKATAELCRIVSDYDAMYRPLTSQLVIGSA